MNSPGTRPEAAPNIRRAPRWSGRSVEAREAGSPEPAPGVGRGSWAGPRAPAAERSLARTGAAAEGRRRGKKRNVEDDHGADGNAERGKEDRYKEDGEGKEEEKDGAQNMNNGDDEEATEKERRGDYDDAKETGGDGRDAAERGVVEGGGHLQTELRGIHIRDVLPTDLPAFKHVLLGLGGTNKYGRSKLSAGRSGNALRWAWETVGLPDCCFDRKTCNAAVNMRKKVDLCNRLNAARTALRERAVRWPPREAVGTEGNADQASSLPPQAAEADVLRDRPPERSALRGMAAAYKAVLERVLVAQHGWEVV